MVDQRCDVARVVAVFAVALGDAGGAGERFLVVALPEMSERCHVFEAGLELALRVPLSTACGVQDDILVVLEREEHVHLGERGIVGERIFWIQC